MQKLELRQIRKPMSSSEANYAVYRKGLQVTGTESLLKVDAQKHLKRLQAQATRNAQAAYERKSKREYEAELKAEQEDDDMDDERDYADYLEMLRDPEYKRVVETEQKLRLISREFSRTLDDIAASITATK